MNQYLPVDIETIPQQPAEAVKAEIAETIEAPAAMTKPETIQDWHDGAGKYAGAKQALIEDRYRKTSFDGARGQICSIAWVVNGEPFSVFAAPGVRSEADALQHFYDHLAVSLEKRRPLPAGHYVGEFDLRFLYQRSVINGVKPSIDLGWLGRHDMHYFCTMRAWSGFKDSISLDDLCVALGIDIESPEGLQGSTVWDFYQQGRYAEIEQYNRADALKVDAIIKRLLFAA